MMRAKEARLSEERASPTRSFESFFEAQNLRLQRAVFILTGNRAEAEEIAQDALAAIWERWDRVGSMDDPEGYLYRTALNRHRSMVRRAGRAMRRVAEPSPDEDPIRLTEQRVALMAVLAKLTRRRRTALVLVDLLGYDSVAAGRVMGITDASVRRLLQEARTQVQRNLEDRHGA